MQVDGTLSVYLEYVSGGSIYKLLQEYGPFKEPVIQSYTRQILSGLAYLHGRNTIHRYTVADFSYNDSKVRVRYQQSSQILMHEECLSGTLKGLTYSLILMEKSSLLTLAWLNMYALLSTEPTMSLTILDLIEILSLSISQIFLCTQIPVNAVS